jgi:hypothetical protein
MHQSRHKTVTQGLLDHRFQGVNHPYISGALLQFSGE